MTRSPAPPWLLPAAALCAAAAPSLLAFNLSPSSTFLNQALALAVWGVFVAVTGGRLQAALGDAAPLLGALALVAAGLLWSWGPGALPASLALSALGLLLAAAVLAGSGAAVRAAPQASDVFATFCLAWVLAGAINTGLAMIQVFAPAWADGTWIARSGLPGRAVGNLRQPNHLSSLLLWAAIALVPLRETQRLSPRATWLLFAAFVWALVLTASRTGLVSVGLLAAWGLLDRRLAGRTRGLLLAAPLLYALAWSGMSAWGHNGGHAFGGEARLAETDISGSRFSIWANTLALIRAQPWAGVGFGEFNLAWTMTPFAQRPSAFFDHAHNLPLQLTAELGLPLGGVVLVLLGWALWRVWRAPHAGVGQRCSGMFVLMIGVHSLLEYPLWYAYFLLPAAWVWGFALGRPQTAPAPPRWRPGALAVAGALMVAAAAGSTADYLRVVRIFDAAADAPPLVRRIADGRRSVLFAHHADYAAATTGLPQADGLAVFDRPAHYLLDTRLMLAWAQALADAGQLDAARHVAARLREFGPARSAELAERCAAPAPPAYCEPPSGALDWRRFAR